MAGAGIRRSWASSYPTNRLEKQQQEHELRWTRRRQDTNFYLTWPLPVVGSTRLVLIGQLNHGLRREVKPGGLCASVGGVAMRQMAPQRLNVDHAIFEDITIVETDSSTPTHLYHLADWRAQTRILGRKSYPSESTVEATSESIMPSILIYGYRILGLKRHNTLLSTLATSFGPGMPFDSSVVDTKSVSVSSVPPSFACRPTTCRRQGYQCFESIWKLEIEATRKPASLSHPLGDVDRE